MFKYKSADIPGLYVLRFELNGKVSQKDVKVRTEKQVTVVADTLMPFLTFHKLKGAYSVGEPINLEIEVTKNVDSTHLPHILVHVSSPNGCSTIGIPRKGRNLYGLSYEQSSVKGEYTFTIAESREYAIKSPGQKVIVLPSQNSSPIMFIGIALGAVLLGCGIATSILVKRGIFQKRTKPKTRRTNAVIKASENVKKDISQEVSEETPVPSAEVESSDSEPDEEVAADVMMEVVSLDEILANFPDKIVCHNKDGIIQLSFQKRKDAVGKTSFLQVAVEGGQIFINDTIIYQSEGKITNNDTIKIGALVFKVLIEDEKMQLQPDSTTQDLLDISEYIDRDGVVRWNIKLKKLSK